MQKDVIMLGDCVESMRTLPDESSDLIFTDPPFNIGLKYDVYNDKLPYEEYYKWSVGWITEASRILSPTGSIYVCIGDEFAAELNIIMKKAGLIFRNWIIWHYTFGEQQRTKFSRCHTHILYFTKSRDKFTFNRNEVLVPSARQLIYKDKRAKAGGKTPDDVWPVYADAGGMSHDLAVYPQDWEVWNDSRVCGTFKERLMKPDGTAHPCQLPLSIVKRAIRASSNPGDLVTDPFCGTGTTPYAAKELGRHYLAMEMSQSYYDVSTERLAGLVNAS